jgi:DNA helicase INO80
MGETVVDNFDLTSPSTLGTTTREIRQPRMLTCQLKGYQLKGLSWLANLYEQGINGILADEMGLGKTVQAISLMAHLAESHNIWGPFLVIAPASTLHNWQQELAKFVPTLRALPYWGNVKDRTTLRRFWGTKRLYGKDSPFHVLITSYQLVVADEKYFQRIKWQYMVLDEAQAIKSSSSVRWKTLLGFSCRNRLLLTGTPIQNSMQELWALLHFIMPGLFDSHDEFSDWFAKDIESHAVASEAKTGSSTMSPHQLHRLHMILKPFMLRRVKKDVENELGAKVEIDVTCNLSGRQRALYRAIKEKLPLDELLAISSLTSSGFSSSTEADSLMNIVMQFRKVCNHPELFERTEIKSPLVMCAGLPGDRVHPPVGNILEPLGTPVKICVPGCTLSSIEDQEALLSWKYSIYSPASVNQDRLSHPCDVVRVLHPYMSKTDFSQLSRVDGLGRIFSSIDQHRRELLTSWSGHPDSPEALKLDVFYNNLKWDDEIVPTATKYFLRTEGQSMYIPNAVSPSPMQALDVCDINFRMRNGPSGFIPSRFDGIPFGELTSSAGRYILMPNLAKLISDSGKMMALDNLLVELKAGGHRVLIYNQMTRMIDLMEEYLNYRGYSYIRLDGSSKIADRRDLVSDWQSRPDIFVFLLSTRAGGLGINLTAADTVIFYDSDWNPTVDQQAMDRAHRLGQTKQVTVYRLITRKSIEERMRQRAKQKDEIHRVVIAGGEFQQAGPMLAEGPSTNAVISDMTGSKPNQKDLVSLLLQEEDSNAPVLPSTTEEELSDTTDSTTSKRVRLA